MGSAFNLSRGVQFFTPVIIAVIAAEKYGLGGVVSLAAIFALLTGAWVWTFPETKAKKVDVSQQRGMHIIVIKRV